MTIVLYVQKMFPKASVYELTLLKIIAQNGYSYEGFYTISKRRLQKAIDLRQERQLLYIVLDCMVGTEIIRKVVVSASKAYFQVELGD